MFTIEQINSLLDILKNQNLIFIDSQLGPDYLSQDEIHRLQSFGINPYHFYVPENDILQMSFHFGLISDAIQDLEAKKIDFEDLHNYFKSGNYIPLSKVERYTLDSIKKQALGDIKALEGKIFRDVNNIISAEEKNDRAAYEKVIQDEILKGKQLRKTSEAIAREIARKTGDWNRNFTRIVEFQSHLAMSEGRAAMIEEKYGKDALVYCQVYDGACQYCINTYLTKGIGSEPRIFKLSKLKDNGTNIGRKVNDYLPIIPPIHPWCRCHIVSVPKGYIWNKEGKSFNTPDPNYKPAKPRERNKIRITIRGKEYLA